MTLSEWGGQLVRGMGYGRPSKAFELKARASGESTEVSGLRVGSGRWPPLGPSGKAGS